MSIRIDPGKCVGCGRCAAICPGNLIRLCESAGPDMPPDASAHPKERVQASLPRRAVIDVPSDCWSCTSCLKECPVCAIALVLPPELGGRGTTLTAKQTGSRTDWTFRSPDGREQILSTDTGEANRY